MAKTPSTGFTMSLTLTVLLLLGTAESRAQAQSARTPAPDSTTLLQAARTLLQAAQVPPPRATAAAPASPPAASRARRPGSATSETAATQAPPPSQPTAAEHTAPPPSAAVRRATKAYRDQGRVPPPVTVAGRKRVPFGHARPVLHCQPLRVSAIRLQPGEKVLSTSAGNQKDWAVQLAQSGPGGRTPVLMVKPLTGRPMETNLIITTTRRVYELTLTSPGRHAAGEGPPSGDEGSRLLQYYYPDDLVRTWARAEATSTEARRLATTRPMLRLNPAIALDEMNHRYRWERGERFPWAPKTVFDDGKHVYIVLPERAAADPGASLFVKGLNGHNTMLNYAPRGNMIITDRLFREAQFTYSERAGDGDVDYYRLTIYRQDD